MALLAAAAAMCVIVAATLSLFIYLPALAVAETISPRRPAGRAAVWVLALALPFICAIATTAYGLYGALHDRWGSPHLTSDRPHLCARWMLTVPDAHWQAQALTAACALLLLGALIRACVTATRSALLAARFRRGGTQLQDGLIVATDGAPFLATIGFLRPVVLATTGVASVLEPVAFRAALAHEQAHRRRRDGLVQVLVEFLLTTQLVSPAAHLFARYWRQESERACDDAAAQATSPTTVAHALTALAQVAADRAAQRLPSVSGWSTYSDTDAAHRASRLRATTAAALPDASDVGPVGHALIGGGVLVVVLGLAATASQVQDTLRCLADTLLALLAGR